MKVKLINTVLAALIAAAMLTGCQNSQVDAGITTAANGVQQNTQAQSDNTAQPETEAAAPEQEDVDYSGIAMELFGALDYIDQIGGTALPYDETVSFTEDGKEFYKVDKTQFSSTADLKYFIESYLTADMIASRYSAILDPESSHYTDHDGELYVAPSPKGCGFLYYQEDNAPVISNETESSFTAQMDYDDFGGRATLEIAVVKDGDLWKINSLKFK